MKEKKQQKVTDKVPQFVHIRNQMYDTMCPPVQLDFAYEDKESGEVIVIENVEKTPVAMFPPSKFTKLYEIGRVKVSFYTFSYRCLNSINFFQLIFV